MVAGANVGAAAKQPNSLGVTRGREEIHSEGQAIDSEGIR